MTMEEDTFLSSLSRFLAAGIDLQKRWELLEASDSQNKPNEKYPFTESFDEVVWKMMNWLQACDAEFRKVA